MRTLYKFIFWLLFSRVAIMMGSNIGEATSSNEIMLQRKSIDAEKTLTNIVSNAFCESSLAEVDVLGKKTLEEVHTYAELKHDFRGSLPDSFTICSTVKATNCPGQIWPTFFNILDNDRAQFLAPARHPGSIKSILQIVYLQESSEMLVDRIPPMFPNQWTKSCVAVNTTSGLVQWVVEGTLLLTVVSEEVKNSKRRPKDLSNKLVLGALSYGGAWEAAIQSVRNLNIFSSSVPIEKMKSMTEKDGCSEEGDYLAWGDMEWILHGQANIETVDEEEPCKGEPYVNLFYTLFPGMDACMHHCKNLGTRVPSVTSSQNWAKLQQSLKADLYDKGLNTLKLWLPVQDGKTEGEWRDFYTDKAIENYSPPWVGSGPDGGNAQNCAYLINGETWGDRSCESPTCACMCEQNPRIYLEFKGLCRGSLIDVYYKPTSDLSDFRKLRLQGMNHGSIKYDKDEKIWLIAMADSNVTGISRASHASFTLGKHNWTIKGDKGCEEGESYVKELKMTGCQKGNFTCNDGQCVSMNLRCNQLPDCRDKSDEKNCQILVLEDGYNKNVPPINSTDSLNVSLSIDLLRLVDIDEPDYSIEIQFEIMLKWKENRVTYHNLKKTVALNALTQFDIEQLWLPEVIYENTDQKESTRLGELGAGEWKTKVVVMREEEDGVLSGPEFLDETEVFSGSQNSLVMNQSYTHTFQCNYQLVYYPFDTQVHTMSKI